MHTSSPGSGFSGCSDPPKWKEDTLDRGEGRDRRILIVDDDDSVRYLCARALDSYETVQAKNGEEAMSLLGSAPADVILTDFMMPVMNGLELLKAAKKKEPAQIVIMMTSFGDRDVVLHALKAGADDFIDKPVNLLQVRSIVERALEKKQLREELFQLKQMDRLKSDFLGIVSHKLKTPVTVITLASQLIREKSTEKDLDPGTRKKLAAIEDQAAYLAGLVEGLLRFSDLILQEGPREREVTDLRELLQNSVDDAKEKTEARGVAVNCRFQDSMHPVAVERKKLRCALSALVDNAVKFSREGGEVKVSAAEGEEGILIEVSDAGAGIPQEEQAKVFEKFYQVDPDGTGQVPGFGLGLFYARRFIEEHGGSVDLASTAGEGTTVTVRLPPAELADTAGH